MIEKYVGSLLVIAGVAGLLYKTSSRDDSIFHKFDALEEGYHVESAAIPTTGKIIYVEPFPEDQIATTQVSDELRIYEGKCFYRIMSNDKFIPSSKPLQKKMYEDYWSAVRNCKITFRKNKWW